MKKLFHTSCFLLIVGFVAAQNWYPDYNRSPIFEAYIDKFSSVAISNMNEFGIPASIILAQAILESGAGRSRLAVEANNHFGIKCHGWTGATIYHDDDEEQECFRKYDYALQSFRDHSLFLTSRPWYAFLFDLEITDYVAWAYGLRKAGYATCPHYPARLISLIRRYDLTRFDRKALGKDNEILVAKTTTCEETVVAIYEERRVAETTNEGNLETNRVRTAGGRTVYQSNRMIGHVSAFHTHEVRMRNGVRYVIALENATFESIANEFGLRVREIYRINDLPNPSPLTAGEIVFLGQKRNASRGASFHVVRPDETMRDISQMHGVRLSSLYRRNNMQEGVRPMIGQRILLR